MGRKANARIITKSWGSIEVRMKKKSKRATENVPLFTIQIAMLEPLRKRRRNTKRNLKKLAKPTGFFQTRKKGHATTRDTMWMTLKAMAMDLAQTLTQIKSFRPFLVVPAEEEEDTSINTNPFILVDLGVAEAARCLGAVNFSNLDRYKLFSQLTSYLIIKQESKNKPRISPKFHKHPSHNCCLTTHPDLKKDVEKPIYWKKA